MFSPRKNLNTHRSFTQFAECKAQKLYKRMHSNRMRTTQSLSCREGFLTEIPGQRPLYRDSLHGQRPPPWTENPSLDRDPLHTETPPGQRPPGDPHGQTPPLAETAWTETPCEQNDIQV